MYDYFTHVKCITVSVAFMFIWTAYTQEEYRDRNIVDGCAFMFKGCDKLNELAYIYKKYNQGTMWKRQVIQFMTCMPERQVLSWNGLFPFIGIHYEAWLTWLTAIFIRASRWYAVSIHRKLLNKSYCSWNDRITVKKWHVSFPVRKNTINSVKVQFSNENRQ